MDQSKQAYRINRQCNAFHATVIIKKRQHKLLHSIGISVTIKTSLMLKTEKNNFLARNIVFHIMENPRAQSQQLRLVDLIQKYRHEQSSPQILPYA
jgi:hypothetical protein